MSKEDFVTEDDIQKALEELSFDSSTDEEIENLVKGGDADDDEEDDADTNAVAGGDSEEESEGGDDEEEEDSYKAVKGQKDVYTKGGKFYKKMEKGGYEEMKNPEGETKDKGDVKKGEDIDDSFDAEIEDEDFEKALEISPVIQRLNSNIELTESENARRAGATATILKGLMDKVDSLTDQLSEWKSEPNMRKSAGARPVERNFSDDSIAKGEGDDNKSLSVSRDKTQILEVLDGLTFAKGYDDSMAKVMSNYEVSDSISNSAAVMIEKATGFKIIA